ncbi:MAG: hypothetical protein PHV32_10625 [Eubacteriales bacterium]|nr:hypothetical protein [Eubacteriales bacterium]
MAGGKSNNSDKKYSNAAMESFTVGNQIGHGGNGCVYDIKETNVKYDGEYEITTDNIDSTSYPDYLPIRQYLKSKFYPINNKIIITEKISIICILGNIT